MEQTLFQGRAVISMWKKNKNFKVKEALLQSKATNSKSCITFAFNVDIMTCI